MALHIPGSENVNETPAKAAPQQQQQPVNNTTGSPKLSGIAGVASRFAPAMNRRPGAETVNALTEALRKQLDSVFASNARFKCGVVVATQQNCPGSQIAVINICMEFADRQNSPVAYYSLMVASSREPLTSAYQQYGNNNYEITLTEGDLWRSTNTRPAVEAYVKSQFYGRRVVPTSGCVVPRDFDITDPDLVYSLCSNSVNACQTALERGDDSLPAVSVKDFVMSDEHLVLQPRFGFNDAAIDPTGLPYRSDITLVLKSVPNQNRTNGVITALEDSSSTVAEVSGYVEFIWIGTPAQRGINPGFGLGVGPGAYQCFLPRFVITKLESTWALTPELQLLALATVMSMEKSGIWMNQFDRRKFLGFENCHDIAGLGYECQLDPNAPNTPFKTDSEEFQSRNGLPTLMSTITVGQLAVSLDVSEHGPDTWFNGFLAAATAPTKYPASYNRLVKAADNLTNGLFSKTFKVGAPIVMDDNNRIPLGYYIDEAGRKRDIREVDNCVAYNTLGEQDLQRARDFADSRTRHQDDEAIRTSTWIYLARGMRPSYVLTGYARRVNFLTDFLSAFTSALHASNLSIQLHGNYSDMRNTERASGSYLQNSVMSSPIDMFNRVSNPTQTINNNAIFDGFATF